LIPEQQRHKFQFDEEIYAPKAIFGDIAAGKSQSFWQ
jgi:hypothetical protein